MARGKTPELSVVYHATKDLIPFENNSRTHSDAQVEQIAESIKEFGFTNPILIDPDRSVIAGHGRLLAATRSGISEVPTITLSGLTEAQKRAYVIADNKMALNAGWDFDLLGFELAALGDINFDLRKIGFSDKELMDIMGDVDEVLIDSFADVTESSLAHQCPKCGFEFD
jgi:ParB-like chromosome segregation protein Spo0J